MFTCDIYRETLGEHRMPDIEKAYHILLAAASDSIDLLEHGNVWDTRKLLQSALLRAEEEAIREEGPDRIGPFPD